MPVSSQNTSISSLSILLAGAACRLLLVLAAAAAGTAQAIFQQQSVHPSVVEQQRWDRQTDALPAALNLPWMLHVLLSPMH